MQKIRTHTIELKNVEATPNCVDSNEGLKVVDRLEFYKLTSIQTQLNSKHFQRFFYYEISHGNNFFYFFFWTFSQNMC